MSVCLSVYVRLFVMAVLYKENFNEFLEALVKFVSVPIASL